MARIGICYPWSSLPGSGNGFLRFTAGRAVCAALRPDLNPEAPRVVLVGAGPLREKWAQMFCDQDRSYPIDVYLKRGLNLWEYAGEFVFQDSTTAIAEIKLHEKISNRSDIVRIIHLKKYEMVAE